MTTTPKSDLGSHASGENGARNSGRTMTDPLIGRWIDGFRIDSLVGRGGMGVVYRAVDDSGKSFAFKLIAPELAQSSDFRERFLREAEIALEHPNIIPVYGAGEDEGLLYIAMHLVEGVNLKQLIARGTLPPKRTVSLIAQAASALDFAHANEMVHRDVKPQNILVEEPNDRVYLTDFGLVKRASSDSSFTSSGHLVGSAHYVPPEQIEGAGVDGRADVYALGCVVYECLTGKMPYERDEELSVLWAHVNASVPRASEELEHLPMSVDDVVAKAMAKAPADRYLTAGDMAAALADAFGVSESRVRSPWAAPQLARSRPGKRPSPRRAPVPIGVGQSLASTRGFLVGAAAMVALIAIALSMSGDTSNRQSPPAAQADAVIPDAGDRVTSRDGTSKGGPRRSDKSEARDKISPAIVDPAAGPGVPTFSGGVPPSLTSPTLRSIVGESSGLTRSLILFSSNSAYSAAEQRFHGSMDLYGMRADGSELRRLSVADANKTELFFDISTCRQVLLLRSRGTALPTLLIQELDGRVIFESEWPSFITQFDWSPDCTEIVYGGLSLMNADGTNQRRLFDHPNEPLHPRWSPDGDRIVFDMRESEEDSAPNIWVINADGTGLNQLTTGEEWEADPWWSPDGRWIVYRKGVLGGGEADIWIMRADGSDQRRLTSAVGDDRPAGWSPDGSYIVFFTDRETRAYPPPYLRGDMYVMNADGTQERDLIPDRGGDEGWASWQPPVYRTISARFKGRALSGRIKAIHDECAWNQDVHIQREEGGGWETIGSIDASPSGEFTATVPSEGVYRARLPLTAARGLICGIAESPARSAS